MLCMLLTYLVYSILWWFVWKVTRIKRNPRLGWEIFKIERKQMRDICFLKFGNALITVSGFYIVTTLKTNILVSILKISQPNHGFRFIQVTL
jgi:hypothetical protein